MARETRTITFPRRTLLRALGEYHAGREQPSLMSSPVERVEFASDPDLTLRVVVDATEQTFSRAELTALLVAYCHRHGVPLPHGGEQAVRVLGGDDLVVLVVTSGPDGHDRAGANAPEAAAGKGSGSGVSGGGTIVP